MSNRKNKITTMKQYNKPSIKINEVVIESYMQTGSNLGFSDEATDAGKADANGRRGLWGDLWDNGEEK